MLATVSVMSTWIEQVAYDTYTHTCIVTINGSGVVYHDVPFKEFRRFIKAEETGGSVGSWYNRYVRGRW